MSEQYEFDNNDRAILKAAATLLKKIATAETTTPAQLVSIAKLQHVFSVLPGVAPDLQVSVTVKSPRRKFGEIETWHWWDVDLEDNRLSISSAGHMYGPNGGDTFTAMRWAAVPEEPAELNDYRDSLRMVPDVWSFPDAVERIDLASGDYTFEIRDEDNPLLEENADVDEDLEEEPESEPDEEEDANSVGQPGRWSVMPIDETEKRLASVIDRDEVDANKRAYAYNIEKCDFCGCVLAQRGLFVDGRLKDDLMWGNMCAACFDSKGAGIGWGHGQLYARQPNGDWRMVAGFRK